MSLLHHPSLRFTNLFLNHLGPTQIHLSPTAGLKEMAGEDWIELKFRLDDGTDIGPSKYNQSMTVSSLKEKIISQWPKGYVGTAPKTVSDVKLINAGKILENNKTLAESRLPVSELPGMIITMHVVLRPPTLDKKSDKQQNDPPMKNRCVCTIL